MNIITENIKLLIYYNIHAIEDWDPRQAIKQLKNKRNHRQSDRLK